MLSLLSESSFSDQPPTHFLESRHSNRESSWSLLLLPLSHQQSCLHTLHYLFPLKEREGSHRKTLESSPPSPTTQQPKATGQNRASAEAQKHPWDLHPLHHLHSSQSPRATQLFYILPFFLQNPLDPIKSASQIRLPVSFPSPPFHSSTLRLRDSSHTVVGVFRVDAITLFSRPPLLIPPSSLPHLAPPVLPFPSSSTTSSISSCFLFTVHWSRSAVMLPRSGFSFPPTLSKMKDESPLDNLLYAFT